MNINSTNNYIVASKLLSILIKVLSIFILCFFNFYHARNYISDKSKIHLSTGTEITEIIDSDHPEKSKIYITSGASILNLKENNFEIVKVGDSKKKIETKSKATKNTKHISAKSEPVKENVTHVIPKEEQETFTSQSESDHAFSVHQNHNIVAAPNQTLSAKHLIVADGKTIRLSVAVLSKATIAAYFSYYNSSIYQTIAFIRPPPVTL